VNKFLNTALMANPYNWVVIVLMIAMAGMATAYIFNAKPEGNPQ
jgi:hypothetical protein